MKKIVFTATLFLFFINCQKKGCIDRLAKNYDSSAKKEATCYYEGRSVLWVDNTTATAHRGQLLDWFKEDELIYSDSILGGQSQEPNCDAANVKAATQDLSTNSYGPVRFKVVQHNLNKVLCDTTVTLFGGYCLPVKLSLKN